MLNKIKRSIYIFFSLSIIIYLIYSLVVNVAIFKFISKGELIVSYGVYQSDEKYGISGKIKSKGAMLFPLGDSVLIYLDENGERSLGEKAKASEFDKSILFIGDSFTFGDGNEYADTYPILISETLKLNLRNASMVGYGLAQFLIKLREITENNYYDYIAIQLSPYSAKRSVNGYLESFVKIPTPYFGYDINGDMSIQSPLYLSSFFEDIEKNDIKKYIGTEYNLKNLFSFIYDFGFVIMENNIKYFIYENIFKIGSRKKMNEDEVLDYFYQSVFDMANEKNLKILFYNVGYKPDVFNNLSMELYNKYPSFKYFINLEEVLWENINDWDEYYAINGIWKGNPLKLVDRHYNAIAHKAVADKFVNEFKSFFE